MCMTLPLRQVFASLSIVEAMEVVERLSPETSCLIRDLVCHSYNLRSVLKALKSRTDRWNEPILLLPEGLVWQLK